MRRKLGDWAIRRFPFLFPLGGVVVRLFTAAFFVIRLKPFEDDFIVIADFPFCPTNCRQGVTVTGYASHISLNPQREPPRTRCPGLTFLKTEVTVTTIL